MGAGREPCGVEAWLVCTSVPGGRLTPGTEAYPVLDQTPRWRCTLRGTRKPCHSSFMGQHKRRIKVKDLKNYQGSDDCATRNILHKPLQLSGG